MNKFYLSLIFLGIYILGVLIFVNLYYVHNKPISQDLFSCLERKIVRENVYDIYNPTSVYYPETGEYHFNTDVKRSTMEDCLMEAGK